MKLIIGLLLVGFVYSEDVVPYNANTKPFNDFLTSRLGWTKLLPVEILLKVSDVIVEFLLPTPKLPELNKNIWWGDGEEKNQDKSIRPFTVQFKDERIRVLFEKLANHERFTKPLNNANFTYGVNTNYFETFLDYWQKNYDPTERAARLNAFPQFITNVQGLDIHFYHVKPQATNKTVVPLLLLHGWPGSAAEYIFLFEYLTTERKDHDFVFEVIAPTIPGFGYSQATSKIGLNTYQVAIIFKNLMTRLGFKKFYLHGGDFGQIIGSDLATLYQDDVLGFHCNMAYSFLPKTLVKFLLGALKPTALVEPRYVERIYPLISNFLNYLLRNFGYFHIHATKPETIGVALKESPVSIASWIVGFSSWISNPDNEGLPDGNIEKDLTGKDNLLDIITILWDSESIVTSIRIYAEFLAWYQDSNQLNIIRIPTKVPFTAIKFRHEVIYQPDVLLKDKYPNLVQSTTLDYGAHFGAYEHPDVLANSIWTGVQKSMNFHNKITLPKWRPRWRIG